MKNSRKEIKKQLVRNVGNYFSGYQEETLAAVYELARCSAEEGIGELEILNLYYDACLQLYSSGMNIEQKKQLKSHLNVLSEFFAPYDMRQRGFSDLIGQLKQQNQKLEKEVKRRKRSEEELIRSKRYFEQLIENALDIITVLSSDGRILYESPSVERILGYRPGNLVGRNVFDYIHREDLEEVRQQFGRLAEIPGRSRSFEFRLRHRDGRWRYIESIAKHVVDFDGESAIIVNSRDITDRVSVHKKLMEAHESLKKSRHKLVSAQRIALLGSWEWDITEDKLIWSDELCGIYGISAAEAPETYDEYLERLHPDDRELARKTIENASKEKSAFEFTYRIYRPDGSARILHARGDLVTDEEGRPVKMIGTGQDVTRMKEVENKLRIYSKELRNLSAKQNMIREEERIRVARVIHDELGQMLTVLKIDISIMMKRAGKASGQTLMSTITKGMDEFSDRIDTIIQSVQRITAELRPEVLDDLGLVEAIEWQASEFEKRTGIRFHFAMEAEPMDLLDEARSTAIFRIFQETLTNILRHSEATEVDIQLRQEDSFIILQVKDNGRGIDPHKIEHSNSLGIIGMRERSQFLGGDISFKNVNGTLVTLKIPLNQQNVTADAEGET